jgi:hypothetical protein
LISAAWRENPDDLKNPEDVQGSQKALMNRRDRGGLCPPVVGFFKVLLVAELHPTAVTPLHI